MYDSIIHVSRKKVKNDVPVSFRIPVEVLELLIQKARREDLNFSQLVRRSLRRELDKEFVQEGDVAA